MIVHDFDGNTYKWPPTGCVPKEDKVKKSSFHLRARRLLHRLLGPLRIMEEVPLPGTLLRLDFYVHDLHVAIEVHGEQHYRYSSFFHGSTWAYLRSKANDRQKAEWCDLNDINLIVFPHNKSDEEWQKSIEQYHRN